VPGNLGDLSLISQILESTDTLLIVDSRVAQIPQRLTESRGASRLGPR
jgi:hypothetical protein